MPSLFQLPSSPPPNLSTEQLFLDSAAAVHLLNSTTPNITLTTTLHAATIKSNLHSNPFLANALLHAYARCGHPNLASQLFDQMPDRDVVSYTTLISAHTHNNAPNSAIAAFLNMLASTSTSAPPPNEFTLAAVLQACAQSHNKQLAQVLHAYLLTTGFITDQFTSNSLLDAYSKSGLLIDAEKLLYELGCRGVVSWSTVIAGCVLNGALDRALQLFVCMLENSVAPNVPTMLSIIQACSLLGECSPFDWVQALVVKLGLDSDPFVANSLVHMYSKNGLVHRGMRVLFTCCLSFEPDTMASVVQGCDLVPGRAIHGLLIKLGFTCSSTIVENALINMYAKHAQLEQAGLLFETMRHRDIVSWNTMISCLVKHGHAGKALQYLTDLHSGGEMALDVVTVLSSVQACSELAALQLGMMLHGYTVRFGFDCDVFICNALIDMYSKAGRIELAEQVFQEMGGVKDLGSWNSLIAAYGMHGDGKSALRVFVELKERYRPNAITFNSVISACGHSGLRAEGCECFESMREYGIEPGMEHYASMVSLLGRCVGSTEALEFIEEIPVTVGADVWGALLGVCGIHGDVAIAERAAEKLAVLEPDGTVWRVGLANVYAKGGKWEDAAEMRAEMRRKGARKEVGWSCVELDREERFRFMAGDTRHPETSRIYEVWNAITKHMSDSFV